MSNFDPVIELHPTNNIDAERIRGIDKDSSGKLWSIYLAEADEKDEETTELWRGEAESILVFTGLFSSVIATFLNMSYNNLFPDETATTNNLLTQISLQLVDISNGVSSQTDATFIIAQPFTPSASVIRINVIWFLSLVLSIASALNATLFQQWSRRYLEVTRNRVAPHKRARTRAYMFNGITSFKMSRAVKAMPILLHLSIFLFFSGLVEFLWNANSTVGHWVLGFISVLSLAYLTFTVLPNLYLNCPYSTPVSELSWRFSQYLLLSILHLIQGLESLSLQYRTHGLSRWTRWRNAVDNQIRERREWLKSGLQKSIILNATKAPPTADAEALSWTLTVLDDDREFEDFVARVPGFFESTTVTEAPSIMLSLMDVRTSQPDEFDPILGSCINDLLRTCVPGTSPLREESRKSRLRVCMRTLWYFAKEYNQSKHTTPLPPYVRAIFATPEMTDWIQSEEDLAARLIGRCFHSLIVKKLVWAIDSCDPRGQLPSGEDLSCLAGLLGKTPSEVMDSLGQPGAIELANLVSLASSLVDTLAGERVPPEVQVIFQTSLEILLTNDLLLTLSESETELPADLINTFQETYTKAQDSQNPDWLIKPLRQISERLSTVPDRPYQLQMPQQQMPTLALPAAGSLINTSYTTLPSREGSASPLLGPTAS
ncbi:hypothetical protein V8E53_001332 [Lactarius tabidus]